MTSTVRKKLFSSIQKNFPSAYQLIHSGEMIGPHVVSPFQLRLPQSLFTQISKFVAAIEDVKNSEAYQREVSTLQPMNDWPSTPSVLTCFDFHYSDDQGLKLIEINTNSSFYILCSLLRGLEKSDLPSMDLLWKSFEQSFEDLTTRGLAIFDEYPTKEAMYFEFLLYQDWLSQNHCQTEIVDLKAIKSTQPKNIYNRFTDFYFDRPESQSLRDSYLNGSQFFSPNPREYFLLADKKRLSLLREQLNSKNPEWANIIPETKLFSDFRSPEDIWNQRKRFFFKPSQSHGGKGAFRGKSISRSAFDKLYDPSLIAQEYCPPAKRTFETTDGEVDMKFDLRIFTFQGQIQNWGARLYQGQTTNMKTPLGGLAQLDFV